MRTHMTDVVWTLFVLDIFIIRLIGGMYLHVKNCSQT